MKTHKYAAQMRPIEMVTLDALIRLFPYKIRLKQINVNIIKTDSILLEVIFKPRNLGGGPGGTDIIYFLC
ncbi:MAG: hypothetical protein ACJ0QZ_01165 [Gammaproteobacteria bacterium]